LIFFFVNAQRVAPPGRSHLALKLEQGNDGAAWWRAIRWEVDEFGEWNGLERLAGLLDVFVERTQFAARRARRG
jgi:hypothetical protein